ncbi:MAG: cytochrome c [Bacteroidetes bacterium]|nr:cytochrome c [Bacteroidota bacterium]
MVLNFFILSSFAFILFSCGPQDEKTSFTEDAVEAKVIPRGEELFLKNCASCHGNDGKLGNSGAKDLSSSRLPDEEIRTILEEGKNAMPAMSILMEQSSDMDSVIAYVKKFRK